MWYYIIVGLQLYCAYHAYTTQNRFYWYLIIFFAPGIGSAIYLITQVFTKNDANKVQKEITAVLNPTKKIKDLEKKVSFSDTFKNRSDLADAYFELGDFKSAITHYKAALNGSHHLDFHANSQLLQSYYQNADFENAIETAQIIKDKPLFDKSSSQFIYGLALAEIGKTEKAEVLLKKIDQRYSNYAERLHLSEFLHENGKTNEAIDILEEMLQEKEHMTKPNKRLHRKTFVDIQALYTSLNK